MEWRTKIDTNELTRRIFIITCSTLARGIVTWYLAVHTRPYPSDLTSRLILASALREFEFSGAALPLNSLGDIPAVTSGGLTGILNCQFAFC